MAHQSRVIVACMAMIVFGACSSQPQQTTPAPSGPAAAVQANAFQGVGVVKGLNLKTPAIEIKHEEIVGLMPAMQMEFPVTDGTILNGLAINDHIDFTVVDQTGQMKVTAIKKKATD